jgi:hypothetical protein
MSDAMARCNQPMLREVMINPPQKRHKRSFVIDACLQVLVDERCTGAVPGDETNLVTNALALAFEEDVLPRRLPKAGEERKFNAR